MTDFFSVGRETLCKCSKSLFQSCTDSSFQLDISTRRILKDTKSLKSFTHRWIPKQASLYHPQGRRKLVKRMKAW